MDLGIKGRVALITAASRGIGRACALALAREGCDVAICARGNDALQATADDIRSETSSKVYAQAADLCSPDDLRALVEKAHSTFGRIDILVAIGGSPRRGSFADIDDEDLKAAFETTVLAVARLARLVVPIMRQRNWGRVITVQSRSLREPIPGLFASNSTRPGAAGLMKDMSRTLASDGILFNTVMPGRILTDRLRTGATVSEKSVDEQLKAQASDIPVGRLGTPEDIAGAVTFLSSERASYINGIALPVDGGAIHGI